MAGCLSPAGPWDAGGVVGPPSHEGIAAMRRLTGGCLHWLLAAGHTVTLTATPAGLHPAQATVTLTGGAVPGEFTAATPANALSQAVLWSHDAGITPEAAGP